MTDKPKSIRHAEFIKEICPKCGCYLLASPDLPNQPYCSLVGCDYGIDQSAYNSSEVDRSSNISPQVGGSEPVREWEDELIDIVKEHRFDDNVYAVIEDLEDLIRQIEAAAHTRGREEGKKDKERLDFLDKCNQLLNQEYGTNYGWELIVNHNVTRLMSKKGINWIDLNDASTPGFKSCRDAIDNYLTPTLPEEDKL